MQEYHCGHCGSDITYYIPVENPDEKEEKEGETMENQKRRILNYLNEHGSITCLDAINDLGCMRLPARISDLKEEGHIITRRMELGTNRYGEPTRYARYYLATKEKEGEHYNG